MREEPRSDLVLPGGAAGPHVFLALLAGLVSIILHAVAVLYLGNHGVRFLQPIPETHTTRTHERRPMRLEAVQREQQAVRTRPEGLLPDDPALRTDVEREIRARATRAPEAALEPDAVEQDGLPAPVLEGRGPEDMPEPELWQPRQEIMMIEQALARDEIAEFERKRLAPVERIPDAADIVEPVAREPRPYRAVTPGEGGWKESPGRARLTRRAEQGAADARPASAPDTAAAIREEPFVEPHEAVTDIKPVEALLQATVTTYKTWRDLKYGYFRIAIQRAGPEILPPVPKDIVLIQDCSSSVAEQRLYFCRQGLVQCLDHIAPPDRFNVISFQDSAQTCFPRWAENTEENRAKARDFIAGMRSGGNTDIYGSIKVLTALEQTPGRPVIAFLITDGQANTGLTRSTDIIGEFSKLNNGAVSVFTMGTLQTANKYLLDVLSYCNRGESELVDGGRWGIPETMTGIMQRISRPVLYDIMFNFPTGAAVEVYPDLPTNLYMDRPLILYGRYPRSAESLVFQAVGRAAEITCDMVFNVDLGDATRDKNGDIRDNWARQKIYHLMGEFARDPNATTLRNLEETSDDYHIRVPYRRQL